MSIQKKLLVISLLTSLPLSASTNQISVKDNLICAVSQTALCHLNEECTVGTAEIANLPLLLRLDLKQKTIKSTRLTGEQRASTILSVNTSKNNLILQGVQEGSGWSMTIDKANGEMSASSSLDGQGYIAFGVCTRS